MHNTGAYACGAKYLQDIKMQEKCSTIARHLTEWREGE